MAGSSAWLGGHRADLPPLRARAVAFESCPTDEPFGCTRACRARKAGGAKWPGRSPVLAFQIPRTASSVQMQMRLPV